MELTAQGHADYDVAGRDIVCAGVSALLYSVFAYLEAQSGLCKGCEVSHKEGDGFLYWRTRGFADGVDITAWEIARTGIDMLAQQYPKNVTLVEIDESKEATTWKT